MKDLKDMLNESLIAEDRLNEADFDLGTLDGVLSFMKKEPRRGNYSPIWGLEEYNELKELGNINKFKSDLNDCRSQIEKMQNKLRGVDVWNTLYEIAKFIEYNYIPYDKFSYKDDAEEISKWKREHLSNHARNFDFGVDVDGYYQTFEFRGGSRDKDAARIIAAYANNKFW